jgi:hypothetical protein
MREKILTYKQSWVVKIIMANLITLGHSIITFCNYTICNLTHVFEITCLQIHLENDSKT